MKQKILCALPALALLCLLLASCGAPERDGGSSVPQKPDLTSLFDITAVPNP